METKRGILWERLPGLQQELAVKALIFDTARHTKDHLLVDFVARHAITAEERGHFLELLKAEEHAYHDYHNIQVKVAELLREAVIR